MGLASFLKRGSSNASEAAEGAEPENCPHMAGCEMYEMFQNEGALEVLKLSYCRGSYKTCARFIRAEDGRDVPRELMPTGSLLGKR